MAPGVAGDVKVPCCLAGLAFQLQIALTSPSPSLLELIHHPTDLISKVPIR